MAETPSTRQITEELMQLVSEGAQLSRSFPSAEDQAYYVSLYPELKPVLDNVRRDCINLTQSLLQVNAASNSTMPQLNYRDPEEILANYNDIVYSVDEKLEYLDNYFDEIRQSGRNRMAPTLQVHTVTTGNRTFQVQSANNLQRPQLHFEPIDNSKAVFIPKITYKYNAKDSLAEVWKNAETIINNQQNSSSEDTPSLPHPYQREIDTFEYQQKQLVARKEIIYQGFDKVPFTWVDTTDKLQLMSDKLEKVEEIAIDIEQHGYRSFQGFCCLMQVSTRTEDFVIDLLALRNDVNILNRSFTNPAIVKVLHGSDNDIVWLQRDHGLYIVNLFDTGQAARQLAYPKLSLSYLLEKFCGLVVDKKRFQLADWRIRPLPQDMLEYARSDTHYLLYIYDRMHNELCERSSQSNLLLATLNNSRLLCRRVYSKDMFQPTLVSVQQKCPAFNATQSVVLKSLFEWRDFTARQEDESIRYVLPNHMLIKIAELLPRETIELFSCCNPQPPPLIKSNAHDVIKIIQDAQQGKPVLFEYSKLSQPITLPFLHQKQQDPHASRPAPQPQKPKETPAPSVPVSNTTSLPTPVTPTESSVNPSLTQAELFEKAEWLKPNAQRTATLDPTNESNVSAEAIQTSTTARFFTSPRASKPTGKLASLSSEIEASLQSSLPMMVPQSMEEIFQFSNANRKRNKEKKRLKEDSINAGPVSPIKFGDGYVFFYAHAFLTNFLFLTILFFYRAEVDPKSKSEKPEDFMREIGWLGADAAKPLLNSNNANANKSATPAPEPASNVAPYDYSKHKSANYGLQKETEKKPKKEQEQMEVSVPHFGKASTRVRASKSNTRTHTSSRGGRRGKPKRN